MKKLFVIFLLFLSFNMYSQYNDVKMYFNDSTSIDGLGYIKINIVYFKLEEKEDFSEWGMESIYRIDFFGFENEVRSFEFIYSDTFKKFHLMELLVEGEVNLYTFEKNIIIVPGFGSKGISIGTLYKSKLKEYFVKHKKDTTATNILFGFNKKIPRFFSDCPDIIEMVNDKTFTRDDIDLIVKYYNDNCAIKN